MCKIIAITDRSAVSTPFLTRVEEICQSDVYGLMLREKDLSEKEYEWLARKVLPICEASNTRLILHGYHTVALRMKHPFLHVPLDTLRQMSIKERRSFWMLGASCHNASEVRSAEQAGCTYVTLSPVFETTCKPGAEPLGLDVLEKVARESSVPVMALGGVTPQNVGSLRKHGAEGICVRGAYMTGNNVEHLTARLQEAWRIAEK